MSRYLVTGGAGFIGSHLVERLLFSGHQVRVLDDLSTGSLNNIPPGVELIQGDVTDAEPVRQAMQEVVGCFHLAAIASVERSNREWVDTHRVNQTGAVRIFSAARAANPDAPIPVVYASSAAVYGDNPALPLSETTQPMPLTAYGADKLGCELHARVAGLVHRIPNVGLRFFNVYGSRQDPLSPYSGVISIFMQRARQKESLAIFGDGGQTRDFVFVTDVAEMLYRAMEQAHTGMGVFNVCTGTATSVRELAMQVNLLQGNAATTIYHPSRPGDIRFSLGNPARAEQVLGFRPATPLVEGLRILREWQTGTDGSACQA
ncbi:MAG: NAD-dependent epimerase/dehydratase family protein [Magnetococcus sp. DMHC-1]|nr:NAD-dependent epimerase/dehydratase family protein [Magnetococcales bacterium]